MKSELIENLHPEIRPIVQIKMDNHVEFIRHHNKPNLIFGNPACNVITAMKAELACWGIYNV